MAKSALGFGLLSLIISMQIAGLALASSQQLTASVNVVCPFALSANALPEFPWGETVSLNYSATANVPCTVSDATGYVGIHYASNSVLAYEEQITPGDITYNAITDANAIFNTADVAAGNYIVTFNLTTFGETINANAQVEFLPASKIDITSVSVASPVPIGSPVLLSAAFKNIGGLASNSFVLYVNITGPSTSVSLTYNELGLSPNQAGNQTASLSGYSNSQGTYNVTVYAVYGNTISDVLRTNYNVSSPSNPAFGSGGTPVSPSSVTLASIPSIGMVYAPLYTSLSAGSSATAPLVLEDVGAHPERVFLSLPAAYQNVSSLSVSTLLLSPGQSLSSTLLFTPPMNASAGTYVIPVNITVQVNNTAINTTTQNFVFYIYNTNQSFSSIMNQVSLLENGTVAQGDVQTTAYAGLHNATLKTFLPIDVAKSKADITAYGIPNNISIENGYYVITWYISNVTQNNSAIAYYQIKNPNPGILGLQIQNILAQQSTVSSGSLLRGVNFAIPAFYTNSTNQVQVAVLYTGSSPQDVYIYLTGPPGVPIENSSRVVLAHPNQLIMPKFQVFTNDTRGTIILYAYVITKGANLTYTLPVSVVNRGGQLSAVSQIGETLRDKVVFNPYTYIIALGAFGAMMTILGRVKVRRDRYSKERENKLVMMRERVKREMGEERK